MKSAIREIELRQNQPRLTHPPHDATPPLPPPLPDGSSACSILPLSFPLLPPPPRRLKCQGASGRFFRAETTKPNRSDRRTDRAPSTQPLPVNGRMETARAHSLRLPLTHTHSLAIHPLSLPSSVRSRRRRWRWSITPPPTTEMTAAPTKSYSRRREEAKTTPELLPLLAQGFIQGRLFWFRLRNNR